MAQWWPVDSLPDVILVDAALDLRTICALVQRIVAGAGRPPAIVSFGGADSAGLASHVGAGSDFLVRPFVGHLIRSRLETCRRNRDLSHAVGEMQAAANRRELQRELQIGRDIQRGFLPESLPDITGWDLAAFFEPAREVSGDFYDAYDVLEGGLFGFAIADVCDKGIGAALFMALIRSLLRQATIGDDTCAGRHVSVPQPLENAHLALRAVRTTNDYLITNHLHQAYFATLFFGVIDPGSGELTYVNCGHNPPIIRRADGEQTPLLPTGPALGLVAGARFELGRDTLHAGDLLFLYTDGIPDAKSAEGEFFGDDRLRETLAEPGSAATVVDRFTRAVIAHSGAAEQFDDVTMLGLRRRPSDNFPREQES